MGRVYLERVSTTAGFLENAPVEFSPKLTCIIGARGTCKSTLIESIRFGLNCDEQRAQTLRGAKGGDSSQSIFGLVRATLGAGTVRVGIAQETPSDRVKLSVERDIDSESRIFVDEVREHDDQTILNCFEIYSQGDLQRIADGQGDRLNLIDRPNAVQIAKMRQSRSQFGQVLRGIGGKLTTLRSQIQKLESSLQDLPNLEQQLQALQQSRPSLSKELEASRSAHLRRKDILASLQDALAVQEEAFAYLEGTPKFEMTLAGFATNLEAFGLDDTAEAVSALRETNRILARARSLVGEIESLQFRSSISKYKRTLQRRMSTITSSRDNRTRRSSFSSARTTCGARSCI